MSKFKVGEEVEYIRHSGVFEATIFGVAKEGDLCGDKYAISYISSNNNLINRVVKEKNIRKLREGCEGWEILEKDSDILYSHNNDWFVRTGTEPYFHLRIYWCPCCGSELDEDGCTQPFG